MASKEPDMTDKDDSASTAESTGPPSTAAETKCKVSTQCTDSAAETKDKSPTDSATAETKDKSPTDSAAAETKDKSPTDSATASETEDKAKGSQGSQPKAFNESIAQNEILTLLAVVRVEALKKWKQKMLSENPPKEAFEKELRDALVYATATFGNIRRTGPQGYKYADELAGAIKDLRNHLGEEIMPLQRHPYFSRGMFEVCGKTLVCREYYEPLPFYGPPRKPSPMDILKFCEWQYIDKHPKDVQHGTPVQCVFYLEKGVPEFTSQSFYVLGMTAQGMHASLKSYHTKPTIYEMEEAIIARVQDEEQGNDSGYEVASFGYGSNSSVSTFR